MTKNSFDKGDGATMKVGTSAGHFITSPKLNQNRNLSVIAHKTLDHEQLGK